MASVPDFFRNKRKVVRWVLLFVLVNAVLLYTHQTFANKMRQMGEKIIGLRSEGTKYKKIGDEVNGIKKKLAFLDKKIQVLQSLEELRGSTIQNLSDILKAWPDKEIALEKFTVDQFSISIDGRANDPAALARYTNALKSFSWIEDARLSSSLRMMPNNAEMIGFHIKLRIKQKQTGKKGKVYKKKKRIK